MERHLLRPTRGWGGAGGRGAGRAVGRAQQRPLARGGRARLRRAVHGLRPRRPAAADHRPRAGGGTGRAAAEPDDRPDRPLRGRRRHDDVRRGGVVGDRRPARRRARRRPARLARVRGRRHPRRRAGHARGLGADPRGRAHRGRQPGRPGRRTPRRRADAAGVDPARRDRGDPGRHRGGTPPGRRPAGQRRGDRGGLAAGLDRPPHHRGRRPAVVDLAARPRALPRLGATGRRPRPAGDPGDDVRQPVPGRRPAEGRPGRPQPVRRGGRRALPGRAPGRLDVPPRPGRLRRRPRRPHRPGRPGLVRRSHRSGRARCGRGRVRGRPRRGAALRREGRAGRPPAAAQPVAAAVGADGAAGLRAGGAAGLPDLVPQRLARHGRGRLAVLERRPAGRLRP